MQQQTCLAGFTLRQRTLGALQHLHLQAFGSLALQQTSLTLTIEQPQFASADEIRLRATNETNTNEKTLRIDLDSIQN